MLRHVGHRIAYLVTLLFMGCTLAANAQKPPVLKHTFEVASVKPSTAADDRFGLSIMPQRVKIENASLQLIISFAFDVWSNSQVQGMPDWARTERFTIDANIDEVTASAMQKLPNTERDKIVHEM